MVMKKGIPSKLNVGLQLVSVYVHHPDETPKLRVSRFSSFGPRGDGGFSVPVMMISRPTFPHQVWEIG